MRGFTDMEKKPTSTREEIVRHQQWILFHEYKKEILKYCPTSGSS